MDDVQPVENRSGNAQPATSPPIYFIGCDMGSWHKKEKKNGDALAVCKWDGRKLSHVDEWNGQMFYPAKGVLAGTISKATQQEAKIIIAVDGALAWPASFADLVAAAPSASHLPTFSLNGAINNPYLYRETERFIKVAMAMDAPLTAPGDRFGNNSSKAQALVAWFKSQLNSLYRPPFDRWCSTRAAQAQYTLIEVYPKASMKCDAFRALEWPKPTQSMAAVGNSDIADAKRCAMTGVCYAARLGMLGQARITFPDIWLPGDQYNGITYNCALLQQEGWIFCPKR